jgi:glucose/arabinose dehydrogenase
MPSSRKIIDPRFAEWSNLVKNIRGIVFLVAILVLSACGGSANQEVSTPTPLIIPKTQISATITPSLPEPARVNGTSTPIPQPEPTPTESPTAQEPVVINFPEMDGLGWQQEASGLNNPVGLASAGDGSGDVYIIEQAGKIRVFRDSVLVDEPWLDISDRVSCCGERGLLGLTFHPLFLETRQFFINYTDLNGDTVIARFEVNPEINQADSASEMKLMVIEQPYANHNGGGIAFGPDGYLYIALGDGGSGGDPQGNSQNTDSLLGKLLRIDINQAEGYAIPPDNPYAGGGGAAEVWASGLRNPWRFSFDRQTGDLFIGDVGQGSWEEIDYLPAGSTGGANFGWNYREGSFPYLSEIPEDELIDPVAEYGRDMGYSVIGGAVYRGEALAELNGIYFYGDYGSGNIWGLLPESDGSWISRMLFQTGSRITSFSEDEGGELYFVTQDGILYKLSGD